MSTAAPATSYPRYRAASLFVPFPYPQNKGPVAPYPIVGGEVRHHNLKREAESLNAEIFVPESIFARTTPAEHRVPPFYFDLRRTHSAIDLLISIRRMDVFGLNRARQRDTYGFAASTLRA